VFDTRGGSGGPPVGYPMMVSQRHNRSTPGYISTMDGSGSFGPRSMVPSPDAFQSVGDQGMVQRGQCNNHMYDVSSLGWNHAGNPNFMVSMRADTKDQTSPIQPAMGYYDQYPYVEDCSPNGLWNESIQSDSRLFPPHRRNAVPFISIDSPTGESRVTDSRNAGASTSYSHATVTTPTSSWNRITRCGADVESGSYLSPEGHDQAFSSRRSSTISMASAPGRLPGRKFGHVATSVEGRDWSPYSAFPK